MAFLISIQPPFAPLKALDKELARKIFQYSSFVRRLTDKKPTVVKAKILGIPSLEEQFKKNQKAGA